MRPIIDPELKVALKESQDFYSEFHRHGSPSEIRQWQLELEKKEQERSREYAELERIENEKKEKIRSERERVLAERRDARIVRFDGYVHPTSAQELEQMSAKNTSYAERSAIQGSEGSRLDIRLDLEFFNLSNSTFRRVSFKDGCRLHRATMKNSKFEDVVFEAGCDLTDVEFDESDFSRVIFQEGCSIKGASFQSATFREDVAIEFDRNYIRFLRFMTRRQDVWASLSRSYTGISQYINVALSGAYFGMLLLKLYAFKALAVTQGQVSQLKISKIFSKTPVSEVSAMDFVFGSDRLAFLIAVLLLIYQTSRFWITSKIAPLIESEKASGFTPDKVSYMDYSSIHKVVKVLGIIAIAFFIFEIASILPLKLKLPDSWFA